MTDNLLASMMAAVIAEPGSLAVQKIPVFEPTADEVQIKVRYTGICGTDLHLFRGSARNAVYPLVPGHEFSGEVVAIGAEVQDIPLGSRVVAEGRAGTGFRRAGAYAEYVSVPREMVHVLPPGLDLEEAALIDPLACALNAVNQAQLTNRDHVVIVGQGSSGLCMLQAALATAGCPVATVDYREDRLALSRELGASLTVNPRAADAVAVLREWAGSAGIDCVLEATGNEAAIDLALRLPRRNGRVVTYGVFGRRISVEIDQIVYNQLHLVGAVGSPGCWPRAIELLAQGRVRLRPLITHEVPLCDLAEAFEMLERGNDAIKVVVIPGG
jgi:2-desacetyl-2-hydroxyethyl bacteriochlorophyllide A dehydrogenase